MSANASRAPKGLIEAARPYLAEGSFSPEKASELLVSAVQQDPTYVNALVLRSSLSSRLGHWASALADLSLAIEVDKNNSDPRRLASLYGGRAGILSRVGRLTDAIVDLRFALRYEPDNGHWCYELGRLYMKQCCISLAQSYLQQTLQEPQWSHVGELTRPKVYALYGRACLYSHEYKKAKMLLHKAIEAGGEAPAAVLRDVGLAHYHDGTTVMLSVDFLTRAVEADVGSVEYPMHLSLALVRCGRYSDALASINEAVLRGHDEARLRFYRGCIELQLGMGPQALMDLQASAGTEDVAVANSENSTATCMTPRASLAMGLLHLFCEKNLASAAEALEAPMLRRTDDPSLRLLTGLLLGIVRHEKGDRHSALSAFVEVLQSVKRLTCQSRSPSRDKPPLRKLGYLTNVEMLALTHLGLVYEDCGYFDLAARHFREAQCCALRHDRLDEARQDLCAYRLAISQIGMGDHIGALHTLRSRFSSLADGKTASGAAPSTPRQGTVSHPETTSAEEASSPESTAAAPEGVEATKESPPQPDGNQFLGHRLAAGEVVHVHAVVLRRLGRLQEALNFATAALDADQQEAKRVAAKTASVTRGVAPTYLYNRALVYFSLALYAEALHDVQQCIRECEEKVSRTSTPRLGAADPYYLQGRIYHALGDYAAALDSLSSALRLDPSLQRSPPFAYSYGVLLAIAGKLDDAVGAFSSAIEACSSEPALKGERSSNAKKETVPVTYYHVRAKVYQQLGHYAKALDDYNVVLGQATSAGGVARDSASAITASDWDALVNRALTLKELKRYEEAALDWDAALRGDRSGLLSQFTSHDVFELPYLHLCLPGQESAIAQGDSVSELAATSVQ